MSLLLLSSLECVVTVFFCCIKRVRNFWVNPSSKWKLWERKDISRISFYWPTINIFLSKHIHSHTHIPLEINYVCCCFDNHQLRFTTEKFSSFFTKIFTQSSLPNRAFSFSLSINFFYIFSIRLNTMRSKHWLNGKI